jgi:hypothetical protein
MDDLGAPFRQGRGFFREIIHNEFGGNPRDYGGIEMRLSKEYQNNFFLAWSSGKIADSKYPLRPV